MIRKTKCHPETHNRLLADFPQEMALSGQTELPHLHWANEI